MIDHRYEVVRLLGSGAMASVYEVRHTSLHSRHAIKVLNAELATRAGLRNRFLSEGRIQAQLRHPNIVPVTDIVTDPVPGLVMEFVEGGSLDGRIHNQGPITDPTDVMTLFVPILDAVGMAHEAGVVHRDLKPENILMGTDGRGRPRPMVADFGIARVQANTQIKGNKRRTEAGVQMGTILYMSPEQVQGAEVDARSDIFALGCILYEILTGQVVFDAPSRYITMKRIVEGDLPLRAVGQLHPAFGACIRKALAVNPDERFQSTAEFQDALESALQDGPLPVPPTLSQAITRLPPPEMEPLPEPEPAPQPEVTRGKPTFAYEMTPADKELDALLNQDNELDALLESVELELAQPTPVPFSGSGGPNAAPGMAAALNATVLLTGVGQLMNGQIGKGLLIMLVHWTLIVFTCGTSALITALLATIDAWMIGRRLQDGRMVDSWDWF
ncbi:MAG: serine/threonine-protein kinase [Myxococcota bacterium]